MRARQRSCDACSTPRCNEQSPGGWLPGAFHRIGFAWSHFRGKPEAHFSGKCFFCVVAFPRKTGTPLFRKCFFWSHFLAENRKSTFPENASFAWSHFLRKTGSPLFRKMLRYQKSRPRSRGAVRGARSDPDRRQILAVLVDRVALAAERGYPPRDHRADRTARDARPLARRVPVCAKAGVAITAASATVATSVFILISGVWHNGPHRPRASGSKRGTATHNNLTPRDLGDMKKT